MSFDIPSKLGGSAKQYILTKCILFANKKSTILLIDFCIYSSNRFVIGWAGRIQLFSALLCSFVLLKNGYFSAFFLPCSFMFFPIPFCYYWTKYWTKNFKKNFFNFSFLLFSNFFKIFSSFVCQIYLQKPHILSRTNFIFSIISHCAFDCIKN